MKDPIEYLVNWSAQGGDLPELAYRLGCFTFAWHQLAGEGQCDRAGGAEYRRVLFEWAEAGCPPVFAEFIRHRANIQPAAGPSLSSNGEEPPW